VARRRKALVDVVRDGTFSARKDFRLFTADKLPWPELEKLRRRYLATPGLDDARSARREIGLELEHAIAERGPAFYLGDLQAELRKLGPPDSVEQLLKFAPRFFRHQAGSRFGRPYHFPPNHEAFLREFWRRDRHSRRLYQVGLLMEPKGCSKTPSAAVLGTHATVSARDAPRVYAIAGARHQADFAHSFAKDNIEDGPLAAWLTVAGQIIGYPDTRGEFEILSAEGNLSAGSNTSAAIFDELFLFEHQHQREAWNSQARALHKRAGRSWVLAISTAGYNKQTLLGEMFDAAIAHPKLQILDDGFHLRLCDTETGFLFWYHGIPEGADFEDPKVIRRATPAPWVKPRDLLRELYRPDTETDELDWLRLHGNQWTVRKKAWFSSGIWDALGGESRIPEGAVISIGIDGARTYDTTSVGWVWINPETGRKVSRAHVWSVRPQPVPFHTFVEDGELDNETLIEPFVHELARRYRIRGISFDPRYLDTPARHLANALACPVIAVEAAGPKMTDAVSWFERDVVTGRIEHNRDPIVRAHISAIDTIKLNDGSTKIGKRGKEYPIDAGTALILANYTSELDLPEPGAAGFSWLEPEEWDDEEE
jgi:phage terminase large subunit-like protein